MTNLLQNLSHQNLINLDGFSFFINVYTVVLSLYGLILATINYVRSSRTKYLRKIWGLKNGDHVIVVCSELPNIEERQFVKDVENEGEREFIYNLKYGDVDAYFEVIVTLLRLFPKIKLRILSSGEVEQIRADFTQHLILIGGPDYNTITRKYLEKGITQIDYRCPETEKCSHNHPNEIVIFDRASGQEYCEFTNEKDYGYFERIKNPDDPRKNIILIGGCHTIGVTGAVKAFSMFESAHGETPRVVLQNARLIAKRISQKSEFVVLIEAERLSQTIKTPIVNTNRFKLKPK
ncbi:MAG TPA: hypothetical protein VIH61_01560 [Waddliaceae bacterium]